MLCNLRSLNSNITLRLRAQSRPALALWPLPCFEVTPKQTPKSRCAPISSTRYPRKRIHLRTLDHVPTVPFSSHSQSHKQSLWNSGSRGEEELVGGSVGRFNGRFEAMGGSKTGASGSCLNEYRGGRIRKHLRRTQRDRRIQRERKKSRVQI